MNTFPTLKKAINSWYAMKVSPSIILTLTNGEKEAGRLSRCLDDELIYDSEARGGNNSVFISDIEMVELSWTGSNMPDMGEMDGTGNAGMAIPCSTWTHKITRTDDDKWLFEEVSETGAPNYHGEIYRALHGE
jgi:hypothetical protein